MNKEMFLKGYNYSLNEEIDGLRKKDLNSIVFEIQRECLDYTRAFKNKEIHSEEFTVELNEELNASTLLEYYQGRFFGTLKKKLVLTLPQILQNSNGNTKQHLDWIIKHIALTHYETGITIPKKQLDKGYKLALQATSKKYEEEFLYLKKGLESIFSNGYKN